MEMTGIERLGLKINFSIGAYETYLAKTEDGKDQMFQDAIDCMNTPSGIPTLHCSGLKTFRTKEESMEYTKNATCDDVSNEKPEEQKINYIDIDFSKVEGFNELLQKQQQLFIDVYKMHNSCQGTDCKEDWEPIKVKWIKDSDDSYYSYLKVVFKNKQWLHYTQRNEWY